MKMTFQGIKRRNVLIIDDDNIVCAIYKFLLEDTGKYTVTTSNSGKEGLMLAKKQKPDVIILDIVMPNMDGGEVAQELMLNDTTKNIPYIFLTSVVRPHENMINNKHHYLGKPVSMKNLISTIEEVVKYRELHVAGNVS